MATPALVEPAALSDFPGTFTATQINIAAAGLRSAAGWHIAPVVVETVTVDSDGGPILFLPTLHLVNVTEVRDVTGDTPRVLTNWRKSATGTLTRLGGWPYGASAIEVDMTHGYDECPPELLPLVVDGIRSQGKDRTLAAKSIGPFSESYRDGVTSTLDPALARYAIPPRP